MRRAHFLALALIAVIAVVFVVRRSGPAADCAISLPSSGCIKLETVNTPPARQTGLSGRTSLAPTEGMLFVFDKPQKVCMWMKDMNFAIDIIWLDDSEKIIQINDNVSPNTYPASFCSNASRYVIELAAGTAEQAGLKLGQQIKL